MLSHREAGEELQMAEVKLAMHKEMLDKDEVCLEIKKCSILHFRRLQA